MQHFQVIFRCINNSHFLSIGVCGQPNSSADLSQTQLFLARLTPASLVPSSWLVQDGLP